jgi:hypothetical protein
MSSRMFPYGGYMLLSPSLHSQCAVVLSHNGIAEVLGLLEYVTSTAQSQPHTGLQRTVLNRHCNDPNSVTPLAVILTIKGGSPTESL